MFPPSIAAENKLCSHTHLHCPQIKGPVILGVDEAGRGPVIGPMVYAAAFCSKDFEEPLKKLGFADSKVLTEERRLELMQNIVSDPAYAEIGWATTVMTAQDISEGMLRPDGASYNLNAQAHDTTAALIRKVLDAGINVTEAYIDTVGPPEKYQAKLSGLFPGIKVTVTKKADSLFPIVSCASICAKVTRDYSLRDQLDGCGSGYPSDPNTVKWLRANMDPLFGWGPLIRYSWGTAREMLDKTGHSVEWPQEAPVRDRVLGRQLKAYSLQTFGLK